MIKRYVRWLHTQWPAGTVERLPAVNADGSTNVPGLYVVGDLTGIPLLKFSADTGARAVQTIINRPSFQQRDARDPDVLDLAIVGGGVSGFAAALEAKKHGLSFELLEASEPFSTIVNFPRRKPIYTYPIEMAPAGELQFHEKSQIKEGLIEDLHDQTLRAGIEPRMARVERVKRVGGALELHIAGGENVRAHRVIVGIGRSGNFRKLGVPGEELDKVYNRLHDPKDFCGQKVLVVGGGDSALEAAIALASCGAHVTLSYRKPEFSRPKPENIEKLNQLVTDPAADVQVEEPTSERVTTATGGFLGEHRKRGSLHLMLPSRVKEIRVSEVVVANADGKHETIPNDAVFPMIGREPPLDFFRRSGVRIRGEWQRGTWLGFIAFLLFCTWLYHWKAHLLPWEWPNPAPLWDWIATWPGVIGQWASTPANLLGTLKISASSGSFYYTLAYALLVVIFGFRRIRRRKTRYVKVQTYTLMAVQCIPLFLLPEILLPWAGHNGWFMRDTAVGALADHFFEPYDAPSVDELAAAGVADIAEWPEPGGVERAYWRAYGFILAWPLMVWNVFTDQPLWGWIIIGFLQTFVVIPWLIYYCGKGAYCGWICPCGALAETLGDTHRHKMPHGPFWNRMNMLGQAILVFAFVILLLRIVAWIWPDSATEAPYRALAGGIPLANYAWFVDLLLAGTVGLGCYFWFSGRMWCRFACPLAALMHIYARFSRFRILADKKKCISCNVCTSVCHQGIDIMNFANKGLPMEDPECVRCSACVQMCPTGVLTFGQIDRKTGEILRTDPPWLAASPVQMAELTVNGKPLGGGS
ncbi:MAG: NAD(P)-binding domain-containing protein [Phycisphaerae bacterium]